MYSTIAVGSDGSSTAAVAVRAAIDIAAKYGAQLLIIGAHENAVGATVMASAVVVAIPADPDLERSLDDEVREDLGSLLAEAVATGVNAEIIPGSGAPADVLCDIAVERNVDLLVVGSKGMNRKVLGSVPNTVTHKAPCSVLLVKTA
ncbi:unannotated protein [freshwater metagenome]|uniref:Unannotated protein n=1 Tax=freshwater metagenome TaxID=449393 RepID=A0A6J7DEV6_9ZZZZ|nr:universal stress protein [Actinomycetota bacterium]